MIAAICSCLNNDQIEYRRAFTVGETLYYNYCRNCHGDNGEGLSSLMPPLTDKVYLAKNKHYLACIIHNGSNKLMIVKGKPFENQMPPSGLAPIEVAQVLTYVKNSFGNKAGLVTLNEITSDLQNCN